MTASFLTFVSVNIVNAPCTVASDNMMCAFSFFVKDDIAVISDLTDKLPYFRKLNNLISMSDGSNFFALDTGKL